MEPIRVALLAGRRRSLASLLMLAALAKLRPQRVEVAAVLAVSEFRWARVWDWYLRFGLQAVTKGLREIGLQSTGVDEERAVLLERMSAWSVKFRSLPEMCRELQIPFHLVPDINGVQARNVLSQSSCDYGVYSGAGILRKPLLDLFPRGVLNLHCGSLPAVRGMNGVEWNLFFGRSPEVTLHFIDPGIDTGRILTSRVIDVSPGDSVAKLRGRAIVAGIDLIAEQLPMVPRMAVQENPLAAGRQYFAMADTLKRLVADRLHQQLSQPREFQRAA